MTAPSLSLYPMANYQLRDRPATAGGKVVLSAKAQEIRLRKRHASEGLQRHVGAVILVHRHRHPHLLLRQCESGWRLPGGRLRPGEGEVAGLKRQLAKKLAATVDNTVPPRAVAWEVTELLSKWWRPSFEPCVFPYLPAHVTKPKECVKLFVVKLPERCSIWPKVSSPVRAVPLMDVYGNEATYGPIIASIPHLLSRYEWNVSDAAEE